MDREMMQKEIIAVVERYINSIHTQRKEDFDCVWAMNSECSLISITRDFHGREQIFDDFYQLIRNAYATIDLINDGIHVNIISDHLAIVIFKYHTECIRRETLEPYGINGLETQVIIKENGQWRLLHVHYSK